MSGRPIVTFLFLVAMFGPVLGTALFWSHMAGRARS
ncbi:MAG: hypothetical protein JWO51_174 [Rhodospirillales bacterium]|nr:hypothetical protein [Rhodospirillales bacterium]